MAGEGCCSLVLKIEAGLGVQALPLRKSFRKEENQERVAVLRKLLE
jgi:hypothetical protein